jgi:hypothetical protein
MDCYDCHGGTPAVGGTLPLLPGGSMDGKNDGNPRRPWYDLPRCQSFHTGDAVNYLTGPDLVADPDGSFRLRQTYESADASASPLLVDNQRFAENTQTLFRFSKGHGGITCESCHGSTHAIWPIETERANDNVAAIIIQGYAGTLIESSTCHKPGSLPAGMGGAHGLHPVNEKRWYDHGHEEFYEADKETCRACHGVELSGTPLAKIHTPRSFQIEDKKTVFFQQGEWVACDRCHGLPED